MLDAYRGTAAPARRQRATLLRHVATLLRRHLAARSWRRPTVPPAAARG